MKKPFSLRSKFFVEKNNPFPHCLLLSHCFHGGMFLWIQIWWLHLSDMLDNIWQNTVFGGIVCASIPMIMVQFIRFAVWSRGCWLLRYFVCTARYFESTQSYFKVLWGGLYWAELHIFFWKALTSLQNKTTILVISCVINAFIKN